MRVIWSPLAEQSLATFPDQGRMVPEVQRTAIREVLVHPYRVVYRRGVTEVVVLSVQHDHRELDVRGIES